MYQRNYRLHSSFIQALFSFTGNHKGLSVTVSDFNLFHSLLQLSFKPKPFIMLADIFLVEISTSLPFPFFSNKMTFFFVKPDDECVPNGEIYAQSNLLLPFGGGRGYPFHSTLTKTARCSPFMVHSLLHLYLLAFVCFSRYIARCGPVVPFIYSMLSCCLEADP